MQQYVKNYLDANGYDENSFIPCERCGAPSSDIHHIIHRSKFGKKRKEERDAATNLIALCRPCHDWAHKSKATKEYLERIVSLRKVLNNPPF